MINDFAFFSFSSLQRGNKKKKKENPEEKKKLKEKNENGWNDKDIERHFSFHIWAWLVSRCEEKKIRKGKDTKLKIFVTGKSR